MIPFDSLLLILGLLVVSGFGMTWSAIRHDFEGTILAGASFAFSLVAYLFKVWA